MVAVQIKYSGETYYIIGEFWEIVARLKAHQARFRFRARRWRWWESLSDLERVMQPYPVAAVSQTQAQTLQLEYDRLHIAPTQEWAKAHAGLLQDSVEWWAATRLKPEDNPKRRKLYEAHRAQVATALSAFDLPAVELEREQVLALQQTRRLVEKYGSRITKWATEQVKIRRREEVLARFEEEMGLSQASLLEVESNRNARQALYEELAGLEWTPPEISELKAAAKILLRQQPKLKATG